MMYSLQDFAISKFREMICPVGAIEVDCKPLADYEIQHARNEFTGELEKAEVEGRFRRLVPIDEVGWTTPYYIVHDRQPRYIIPENQSIKP